MKHTRLKIMTAIAVCLLVLSETPVTLAILHSRSAPLQNVFTKKEEANITIRETLGATKQVYIENSGNVAGKVEVRVSVVYRSNTVSTDVLNATNVVFTGSDPTWQWTGSFALWNSALLPGGTTGPLFTNVTADAPPDGYHLEVKVIAQN